MCPVTSLSYNPVPASPLTASGLRLFNGLSGIREALTIPSNLFDMSNHYDFVRKVAENIETVVGETHQVAT